MPRITSEFQISNALSRRYLRDIEDRLGQRSADQLVHGYFRRHNIEITPRRTGRLQRSMRTRRIRRFLYRLSFGSFYASYVERRRPFIERLKRAVRNDIRNRAREVYR